ncbi:concanavalin A-like lectin/glucanase domain-containing protein [Daedaleopsis nitida]|nr:concanavalin A-like lectin/glucanase domain-containing protein [Daedaleopsis nitida]
MHTPSTSIAYTLLLAQSSFAAYNLVRSYSGNNFFDGWDFATDFDNTTNGAVNWLNQSASNSANLTSVTSDGRVIIKVDDFTNIPNDGIVTDQLKRDSISISTHEFFPVGSVFLFDANHIPFGCSVWPAFWTRGPNWPNGGEIDILETVNLAQSNQMALHTLDGCTTPQDVSQLGTTKGANCSEGVDSRVGCATTETQPNSVGAGFATAGGGVWATLFDTTGISIWFWTRSSVPDDVKSATNSIDPSSWGKPSAAWPASSCNINNLFTPQQLVIDVTLCGDLNDSAGQTSVYQSTCGKPGETVGPNTCYIDNVNGTGANYHDAFFDINAVKVFSLDSAAPLDPSLSAGTTVLVSATASPSGSSGSNGNSDSTGNNGSGSGGGGNGAAGGILVGASVVGASVIAAFAWVLM